MTETEEPKIRSVQLQIAKTLHEKGLFGYDELFDIVYNTTGHGKPTFDAGLNRMIGAREVRQRRRKIKRVYELTEPGIKKWIDGPQITR